MLTFRLSAASDSDALGRLWRELEARADGSFFTSWSWLGRDFWQRFSAPLLFQADLDGRVVGLGLFNARRPRFLPRRLWLHETGNPVLDSIYVEHNGFLIEQGLVERVLPAALRHLADAGLHLVFSGVDPRFVDAAMGTGALVRAHRHPAASPWVDLDALRFSGAGHLAGLSANTRQQVRRSLRRYGDMGGLRMERATSLDQAQTYLAALGVLHQRTWTERGKPGAFANPHFMAFHQELLAVGWPRGEIDLLRVAAGERVIGYLYNFRWRGTASNYQSGFDYEGIDPQHKPGLTCHHLAVEMYAAEGLARYDFLAGNDRYKASLATETATLHWVEMMPRFSLPAGLHRLREALSPPPRQQAVDLPGAERPG